MSDGKADFQLSRKPFQVAAIDFVAFQITIIDNLKDFLSIENMREAFLCPASEQVVESE